MSAVIKNVGPGRPKDLEKRAAILNVAKRLFTTQGFDSTSMDAIAAAAGVSKLTVYSHFQDKERLFTAAVECVCAEQMPAVNNIRITSVPRPPSSVFIPRFCLRFKPTPLRTNSARCVPARCIMFPPGSRQGL